MNNEPVLIQNQDTSPHPSEKKKLLIATLLVLTLLGIALVYFLNQGVGRLYEGDGQTQTTVTTPTTLPTEQARSQEEQDVQSVTIEDEAQDLQQIEKDIQRL